MSTRSSRKRPLEKITVLDRGDRIEPSPGQPLPFFVALSLHGLAEDATQSFTMQGVTWRGASVDMETVPPCFRSLFLRLEKRLPLPERLAACCEMLECRADRAGQVAACDGARAVDEQCTSVTVRRFSLLYLLSSRLPHEVRDRAGTLCPASPFLSLPLPEALKKRQK